MVAVFGVDDELADDLAGGGVDDAHVVVVDEQDDAGSVEGSAESDVVHVAVDAQADASGVDSAATFIWGTDLDVDNTVLLRATVTG